MNSFKRFPTGPTSVSAAQRLSKVSMIECCTSEELETGREALDTKGVVAVESDIGRVGVAVESNR